MSEERGPSVSRDLEEFFGEKKAKLLRSRGSTCLIPLGELCETGDMQAIAKKKSCAITIGQWVGNGVRVVNIIPESGGPLVLFTSKQDKGEFPNSYILDNDLDRFREIFGGAVK